MKKYIIGLIVILMYATGVYAQCPEGSTMLSGSGTVTISTGQEYCIPYGEVFNGSLTINGGTLNINGMCTPVSFQFLSGTVQNQGLLVVGNFNSYGNIINNKEITIRGDLNINSGSIENSASLKIEGSAFVNSTLKNYSTFTVSHNLVINSNGIVSNSNLVNVIDSSINNGTVINTKYITIYKSFTNNGTIQNTGNIVASNSSMRNIDDLKQSVIVDQFGNIIDKEQLRITSHCEEAGYFRLHFMDQENEFEFNGLKYGGTGFGFDDPFLGQARRDLLVRVFKDVSSMIERKIPEGEFVEIMITRTTDKGVTEPLEHDGIPWSSLQFKESNGSLGRGIVYWDATNKYGSMAIPIVQKYIQTGHNPWGEDDLYHAILNVDFYDTEDYITYTDVNWNTDLSRIASEENNEIDMYSVVLHEVFHILGIAPRITLNDPEHVMQSYLRIYSYFDKFLKNDDGESVVLLQNSECENTYRVNNNIEFHNNDYYFFDLPGTTEDVPIWFSHIEYESQSFAHLGTTSESEYVMSPSLNYGQTKRFPCENEMKVFGALGYNLTGVYGDGFTDYLDVNNQLNIINYNLSNTPSNPSNIAVDDFYIMRSGETITINIPEITLNDKLTEYDGIDFNLITSLKKHFGGSAGFPDCNTGVLSINSTQLIYTPDIKIMENTSFDVANFWLNYIQYCPYKLNGAEKEYLTSGYIVIRENYLKQLNQSECPINDYNFVCDGEFEDGIAPVVVKSEKNRGATFNRDLNHWNTYNYNPDYVIIGDLDNLMSGIPDSPSDRYIGMSNYSPCRSDSFYGILNMNLSGNVLYNVSYWSTASIKSSIGVYLKKDEVFNIDVQYSCDSDVKLSDLNSTQQIIGNEKDRIELHGNWNYFSSQFTVNDQLSQFVYVEEVIQQYYYIDNLSIEKAVIQSSSVSNQRPTSNEQVTITYRVFNPRKDNQPNEEAIVFNVLASSLPEGVQIVSGGANNFDSQGNLTIPVGQITTELNITLKLKYVGATLSEIECKPLIQVVSAGGTTNDGLIYEETAPIYFSGLTWDIIMSSESNSYNTPDGDMVYIDQVGPLNTADIRAEVSNNSILYQGMTEQESTIAAVEKLYGNGCTFAISAQNAWYVLGLANEYEIEQIYNLESPTYDVSGVNQMYHASENIIASNVISSGANVELKAGNTITLMDGFESTGSYTHAFIVQCDEFEVKSGEGYVKEEASEKLDSTIQDFSREVLITISPNPTSEEFEVISNHDIDFITIASMSGTLIQSYEKVGTTHACSVCDLSSGIYLVTVKSFGKVITEKLIVYK